MGLRTEWEALLPSHGIQTLIGPSIMIDALVTVLDKYLSPPREELIRASGDVLCDECGDTYYHHPHDMKQLDSTGEPFLRVRCDKQRLKL